MSAKEFVLADIKSALKTAGVKAKTAEPFDLHGQKDCFVITIEKDSAMESWQKLRSSAEKTGYYPVFPGKDALNRGHFVDLHETVEAFVPAPEPVRGPMVDGIDMGAYADASERRNVIRKNMLEQYDVTDATEEQLNKPLSREKFEGAASKIENPAMRSMVQDLFNAPSYQELRHFGPPLPSMNEMIAEHIERVEQMVQMRADLPNRRAHWDAVRKFEIESLSKFCKVGKHPSLKGLIGAGENLDVEKWLDLKRAETEVDIGNYTKEKWPPAKPPTSKELLLLPVNKAWHVPAFLRLGNWNENPPAHVHVAMLKRWHDKFGAEVVTVARDTMHVEVKEPASTKEAALELAFEQFAYCSDTVFTGGDQTISGLAIDLLDSKFWHFWWD